ncbi:MAG TPA: Slp family lipoprotein [Nitrospira sp.]|nr:Slp family lipoprotein [Nitrospira sp.]
MSRLIVHAWLLCAVIILSACAESLHQVQRDTELLGVPIGLEKEIDTTVRFTNLKKTPSEYIGRTVMIGGTVIRAKLTAGGTEVEVLQLPAENNEPLTEDRLRSEGRFLAVREAFLDPASLPEGTPVTVIGTVTGETTRPLDESTYTYPLLTIKHIIDWSRIAAERRRDRTPTYGFYAPPYGWSGLYPYGAYGGALGGYWGSRGFYGPAPYFTPRSTPPPPPPPRTVHPRLRGR